MNALIGVVALLVIIPAATLLEAWVLIRLWAWHIIPRFHVEALTYGAAVGISCVASLLTQQYVPAKEGDGGNLIASHFTRPLLILLIGWCAA